MRVLLIAPGEFRREGKEIFALHSSLKRLRVLPSLGLCCLSAALRRNGHAASVLDAYAEDLTEEAFTARVRAFRPDVLGVTSTTPFFDMAASTCRVLKRIAPNVPLVLGGPHVTVMKKDALLFDAVDYGVIGEGEQTLVELVDALEQGTLPGDVPNVLFRCGGGVVMTRLVERRQDLDTLPMPDRSDLPLHKYYDSLSVHGRAMSMMTTRGCPFRCLFCEPDVRGGRFRKRSVDLVLLELRHIVEDLRYREVVIYDDTFTVDRRRTVAFCEGILRAGLDLVWDCRTRVDCVDPDLLGLMRRAGCHRISLGVEAGSPRVREILRKGISDGQIRAAFRWCREAGIRTIGYFMLGTPGETRAEILHTIAYAKELRPDIAHFCITAPYPGTDLYRLGVAGGHLPPDYWASFVRSGARDNAALPYFTSDEYDRSQLDELLRRAYREFYIRPGYVMDRISSIRTPRQLVWHLKLLRELLGLVLKQAS